MFRTRHHLMPRGRNCEAQALEVSSILNLAIVLDLAFSPEWAKLSKKLPGIDLWVFAISRRQVTISE